jgi:hypothetical protein
MNGELFEAPFNLAGELIDNSVTAEGEARVRALAEAEARKAQLHLLICDGDVEGVEDEILDAMST